MSRKVIVLTGSNGNMGQKLATHFLAGTTSRSGQRVHWHVKLLDDYDGFWQGDRKDPSPPGGATGVCEYVQADLRGYGAWTRALAGADAVVHLQAWNPYPEATWEDSRLSMEMTANVIEASKAGRVRRFIFASSNHMFGRYWREGPGLSDKAPLITVDTPPNVGTQFRIPAFDCDATPYAAAKLMGETCLKAAALATPGFSGISLRIGWCQPGANTPDQMSPAGTPTKDGGSEAASELYSTVAKGYDDPDRVLQWFENMWFSNRDMLQAVERCVDYESDGYTVVYGMSDNSNMRWDVHSNPIGYRPQDNVAHAKAALKSKL